ncbi:MAG: glutamine--fructose-6-phosphate transaminase (isomerizing) [Deltaproteobacteria bacterium]|nr:glutamine--fructose-6-phosphate transaminase (isomerizing) [Deltaproteobacteria bacterium]
MCGIVGYIGDQKAEPILMNGLRCLEYRGYDSAGLAFLYKGDFQIARAKGKLSELEQKIQDKNFPATIGIGHTRWATHGKPDEINAHPHFSKDVVLVHNGIIENYRELKSRLLENKHQIVSETDTEIICHLIQDHLDQGKEFESALHAALAELHGAFSLVILHRADPETIYTARMGSPLVVGQKQGESFVASDIPALLAHTNDVAYLHDGEMAVLSRNGIRFTDFKGNVVEKEFNRITWTAAQAEKSGYKHFMLKEIHEQPRVLADTLMGRVHRDTLDVDLAEANELLKQIAHNDRAQIQIIACGTSWHAGLVGKYWIENLAKIPVSVDLSSEFRYRQPLVNDNTLVVAISQSGETADTLAAIRESKQRGAKVLSICNVLESSIPRESDQTVYTLAGPEIGVASTKAFTTQMAVLYMIAVKLAFYGEHLEKSEAADRIQALLELPNVMKSFLRKGMASLDSIVEKIYQQEHCYFLGRGMQFPIMLEGALKLKEISYVHAEGYAGGEMKHGPIALIEEGIPVVASAIRDDLYEKMISNVQEIKARGAMVFALVSEGDEDLADQFDDVIAIPKTHADLNPFLTTLPLQLLAYHVADRKGTDVDQPRNLAKSVTVE